MTPIKKNPERKRTPFRYDKYVQFYIKSIQFILWHTRDMPSCFNEPDFADIADYFRLV